MRETLKANALQLAAQLPEDHDEAIVVLKYLNELVEWGSGRDLSTPLEKPQRGRVVRFPGPDGSIPSRRCISKVSPPGTPK